MITQQGDNYLARLLKDSKEILLGRVVIPVMDLSPCGGSGDMKCHVASTGSILDLVGDRVHGWDRSSSRVTRFGVIRIGFGATTFSWLLGGDVPDKSGGVLRRGTPVTSLMNWKEQRLTSKRNKAKGICISGERWKWKISLNFNPFSQGSTLDMI